MQTATKADQHLLRAVSSSLRVCCDLKSLALIGQIKLQALPF